MTDPHSHRSHRKRIMRPGPMAREQKAKERGDKFVSKAELWEIFEKAKVIELARDGKYIREIADNSHPSAPKADVPFCTRSQTFWFHDRFGNKVAFVHRYLLPNGKVGASGMDDPKEVLFQGTWYRIHLDQR